MLPHFAIATIVNTFFNNLRLSIMSFNENDIVFLLGTAVIEKKMATKF